jgi:hypothetical protein
MSDEPRVQQLLDEILDSERTRKTSWHGLARPCTSNMANWPVTLLPQVRTPKGIFE